MDVRVMVPRVRRAVEGYGAPEGLTDDEVKDLVADAIAEVILYTGSIFGSVLEVTDSEGDPPIPTEYATSAALTLPQQTVVAAQAALNHFFHEFSSTKLSEKISDEAQTWEITRSAQLVRDQFKLLVDERDKALEAAGENLALDVYESFLHVRDAHTAALIEPWTEGAATGGLEIDYRFGG